MELAPPSSTRSVLTALPNTRSAIVPDADMAFVEVDLRQADAQVVMWESDCRLMKDLLRRRVDIYTESETHVWDDPKLPGGGQYPPPKAARQLRKNIVHSGDYGAGPRTIADKYTGDLHAAEYFLTHWFAQRPEVREWQRRIAHTIERSRNPVIRNVWGFRRVYAAGVPVTQPLAWIGQSTVSITKNHMMLRIHDDAPWAELKMEYHDSLLLQVPRRMCPDRFPALVRLCDIEVPFPHDPLHIPVELKWSLTDWGHMQEWIG